MGAANPLARGSEFWNHCRTSGSATGLETALKTKRDEEFPVSLNASVIRDRAGDTIGIVLVATDLREMRRLLLEARAAAAAEREQAAERAKAYRELKALQAALSSPRNVCSTGRQRRLRDQQPGTCIQLPVGKTRKISRRKTETIVREASRCRDIVRGLISPARATGAPSQISTQLFGQPDSGSNLLRARIARAGSAPVEVVCNAASPAGLAHLLSTPRSAQRPGAITVKSCKTPPRGRRLPGTGAAFPRAWGRSSSLFHHQTGGTARTGPGHRLLNHRKTADDHVDSRSRNDFYRVVAGERSRGGRDLNNGASILIVDDEATMREACHEVLDSEGFILQEASSGEGALDILGRRSFDLLILDLKMPRVEGLDILRRVQKESPGTATVVITGYPSIDTAVEAMRLGAADFLPKPFTPEVLRLTVRRALNGARMARENQLLWSQLEECRGSKYELIGQSAAMQQIHDLVQRVGPTDSTVLITGESGTGKELVAREIRNHSPRRDKPFVTVDCGALVGTLFESELFGHIKGSFTGATSMKHGRFELANGGIIFSMKSPLSPRIRRTVSLIQNARRGSLLRLSIEM
jgi:DNA-binding NarL/FixJ family response regulator